MDPETLGLKPHPEGGYFRETWRSAHCTVIDFLLPSGRHSGWHRVLGSDEVWTHSRGGPLALNLIHTDGRYERVILGPDRTSAVVPPDAWQAAEPLEDDVLVCCVVSPPFEFARFELASEGLADELPEHAVVIRRLLTRV